MKTIDLNDASASLSEYARNLGSEPLLLTEFGRTVEHCQGFACVRAHTRLA